MLKEKKQVWELGFEEIEKKVDRVVNNLLNFKELSEKINNEVDIFADFFQNDFNDNFTKIHEIYINNHAGFYTQKEWIELFGFELTEKDYKDNFEQYLWIAEDIIMSKFEKILRSNLNLNSGVDIYIGYSEQSDICLFIQVDYDYIPKQVDEKLITSTDYSLVESLYNYSSLFQEENHMLFVKSRSFEDGIFYQKIWFNDNQEMIEFVEEEIDYAVLGYLGEEKTIEKLIKQLKKQDMENSNRFYSDILHYISSILDYYSLGIRLNKVDNHIELLQELEVIE